MLGWLSASEEREAIVFPPLSDYAEWVVSTARQIGLGNGDGATGYGEIMAWCQFSGIPLTLWEGETVKALSDCFVSSLHEYREECLPPWMPPGVREKLESQLAKYERDFGMLDSGKGA